MRKSLKKIEDAMAGGYGFSPIEKIGNIK